MMRDMTTETLKATARRVGRTFFRGVPEISPQVLGLYRIFFGCFLFWLVLTELRVGAPLPRDRQLSHGLFGGLEIVHQLALDSERVGIIWRVTLGALAAFTLGLFTRAAYICAALGILALVTIKLTESSMHNWSMPVVLLLGLCFVPWRGCLGLDQLIRRLRGRPLASGAGQAYGFAIWLPGLALGVAWAAAAYAKLDKSGIFWATSGAVKYHFLEDALRAPTDWGLWIAGHGAVAILFSCVALLGEGGFFVVIFFRKAWVRICFGLLGASFLAGLYLFQGIDWWAWWLPLIAFLPWESIYRCGRACLPGRLVGAGDQCSGSESPADLALRPMQVFFAIYLVVSQVIVSLKGQELEPLFSTYPMYTYAWKSDQEFDDSVRWRKYQLYWFGAVGASGEVTDITAEMSSLGDNPPLGIVDCLRYPSLGVEVHPVDLEKARAVARLYRSRFGRPLDRVLIAIDRKAFDFDGGKGFYWKERKAIVGIFDLRSGKLVEFSRDPAVIERVRQTFRSAPFCPSHRISREAPCPLCGAVYVD